MNSRFTVLFLSSFSFASAVGFADSARVANLPRGSVELLSKYDSAPRTGLMKLGLHFQLERGFHIYWKNPGDSGQAPRIHWTSPAGMNAGESTGRPRTV